jgi:hypothetical protein
VSPGPCTGSGAGVGGETQAWPVNMIYVIFVLGWSTAIHSGPDDLDLKALESSCWLQVFFLSQFSSPNSGSACEKHRQEQCCLTPSRLCALLQLKDGDNF